jgi:membrane protein
MITLNKHFMNLIINGITKSWRSWQQLDISTLSASVAYYAVFSIAPLFIIAIAVASLIVDNSLVTANVIQQFNTNLGIHSGEFVTSLLQNKLPDQANIVAAIAGALIIIVAASNTFTQLQKGLDRVFAHQIQRRKRGLLPAIARRLVSIGIVLSIGLLLVISLLMTTALSLVAHKIVILPQVELLRIIELTVSLILTSLFFAITYNYLPSKRIGWKPALVAGLFSGILFFVSKTILQIILIDSTFSAYGGASTLVLLIFWIYVMSQIFFASAFIARIYLLPKIEN